MSYERISPPSHTHKIIDKINHINNIEARPFYSFEYFPPKTDAGITNLYQRIERMCLLEPAFIDCTWGAGGSTSDLTKEICINVQNYENTDVMMHLTCTNMPVETLKETLNEVKKMGIRNILALRGDPPRDAENWTACSGGFTNALELVKFIRAEHGDYFGISVAGYPEGHIESASLEEDLKHLHDKVKAGADFIITQLFYDVDVFLNFVKRCRNIGITVPIIPGIMPIQSYGGFQRMVSFCKTYVPPHILAALEPIQNDDKQIKAYGIKLGIEMCQTLLSNGTEGLHFYTLNLERSTLKILEGLGLVTKKTNNTAPWNNVNQSSRRSCEAVRPIFWANRPASYLARTQSWDEFPNGRWGDARSAAFGDLNDYHLCPLTLSKSEVRRAMWGEKIDSIADIASIFNKYINGDISKLPWCETALHLETSVLKDNLMNMISHYFFTINSQPKVNGASSMDPSVGWGGPNGYVYQKAYLEFFTNRRNLEVLTHVSKLFPSITFHAMNIHNQAFANCSPAINAVTWGVFPNSEIKQPTVVCAHSFGIWKDEAFALWKSQWVSCYEKNSTSYNVLETVRNDWWLVNVVDNDYINGDIYAFINAVIEFNYDLIDPVCKIESQIEKHAIRMHKSEKIAAFDYDLYDD